MQEMIKFDYFLFLSAGRNQKDQIRIGLKKMIILVPPFLDGCFNWTMNQIFTWEMDGNGWKSPKIHPL